MSNFEIRQMYDTKLFTEIYDDVEAFKDDYETMTAFQTNEISTASLERIYYILYASYGNSPIANYDVNQFKYKLFMTIWQFAPTWLKKVDIQGKLRSISDDDLLKGAKAIYNHAFNPETMPSPSTDSDDPINFINEQNVTNYKKSKMDAYAQLWSVLVTDVTTDFIKKFQPLFKKFVKPGTYLYESEE